MKNLLILIVFALISVASFAQTAQDSIPCQLYAPNAITPDNDMINDVWRVSLPDTCYTEYRCMIFNRAGEKVWESNDPTDQWIGNVNDGTYYVQNENYTYLIFVNKGPESYTVTGRITIIR